MPRMVYECSLCGAKFGGWDECWEHERKAHVAPLKILEARGYRRDDGADCPYPELVTIRFADDSVAVYRFEGLSRSPAGEDEVVPDKDYEADG